jgi:glycosyltransferase involved in cell wall biosynthesis
MKPIFSIITPTYNRGYILWKTIQSVQRQSYPYWEMIIVDDGSTDETKKVVAEFQKDPRITYIAIPNGGVAHARNEGLKRAQGTYITYLDSDDTFYENCLATALEYFKKYPDTIFAIPNYNRRMELYDKDYKLIDFTEATSAQKVAVTLEDIYHWTVKSAYGTGLFHTRKVVEDGICWDESIKLFDDWDFVLMLGEKYPRGFVHIPFALYEYLQKYGGDGTCSQTTYAQFADGFEAIYQKHKSSPFMQGQTWYPERIERYRALHEKVLKGEAPPAVYKYFPDHFNSSSQS